MGISEDDYDRMLARTRRNEPVVPLPEEPAGPEAKLHDQILSECRYRGWYTVHSRTDKPTTTRLGVPDIIIFAEDARVICVECKVRGGKLTPEQAGAGAWLTKLGHEIYLIRSFKEFLQLVPPRGEKFRCGRHPEPNIQ